MAPAAGQEDRPPELRSYQLVAERVREYVRDAGIPAGGRLPAERILAPLLGVSRASLREALIALELGGAVEVRGGSGVYLSASPDSAARVTETGPGPFEVLASRRLIEPEAAAMAARVATPAAIEALLKVTEELERQQHDKAGCESADRAFTRRSRARPETAHWWASLNTCGTSAGT